MLAPTTSDPTPCCATRSVTTYMTIRDNNPSRTLHTNRTLWMPPGNLFLLTGVGLRKCMYLLLHMGGLILVTQNCIIM